LLVVIGIICSVSTSRDEEDGAGGHLHGSWFGSNRFAVALVRIKKGFPRNPEPIAGAGCSDDMKRHAKIRPTELLAATYSVAAPVVFCAAAILLDASVGWAQIQNPWKSSEQKWAIMDQCKRQGLKAFPDYTAESLRKRDHAVNQCLAANNLPPVARQAPQPSESGTSQR
jgi:hypothetical protein